MRATPHHSNLSEKALRRRLDSAPRVDLVGHMQAALEANPGLTDGILLEIDALGREPNNLTADEYFYYRLYEPALTLEEKRRFLGKRAQARIHAECNDPAWQAVAHDKLLFHERMTRRGLPVPILRAVYGREQAAAGATALADRKTAADFLRRGAIYPFFAKPIDGMFSLGAFSVTSYDSASDSLILADGDSVPVDRFVAALEESDYDGYLLQERLHNHYALAQIIGERIASVRLLVIVTAQGPEILRALCKIPTGKNVADNFWRPGNMLGAIDLPSGELVRVVSGVGRDQQLHRRHPDTGGALLGMTIPLWSEAQMLCLNAARELPGIRTQSWDVAITPRGPILVEVNWGGDLNLAQIATGTGILDDRFKAHIEACAYARRS